MLRTTVAVNMSNAEFERSYREQSVHLLCACLAALGALTPHCACGLVRMRSLQVRLLSSAAVFFGAVCVIKFAASRALHDEAARLALLWHELSTTSLSVLRDRPAEQRKTLLLC